MNDESVFACNIHAFTPQQRARHTVLARRLRDEAEALEELSDGYAFRFPADANRALELTEFATLERLCCSFLKFELSFEANGGPLRLALQGPEGVKGFLAHELQLFEQRG